MPNEVLPKATKEQPVTAGAKPKADPRPSIFVNTEVHRMVGQAIAALALDKNIYSRGASLVHVVRDAAAPKSVCRPVGAVSVRAMTAPVLLEALSRAARWQKKDRKGVVVPSRPDLDTIKALRDRGAWPGILPLRGVIEAPALRADGTVIETAGYDEQTGFLFAPSAEYEAVPERPTRQDALAASEELLDVVCDFPFAADFHRAGWLALILTAFCRPALAGCVPLFAFDAPTPGTGKSRLVDTAAIIATGRDATRTTVPEGDAELRKRILGLLLDGDPIVVLDNAKVPIDFPSLDALLTGREWKDRILGRTSNAKLPNETLWAVTGNNLEFGSDTIRRTLRIRLESKLENPQDRRGFRHANLLAWVREQRPRLVRAALTILRAYFVAGRPRMGCQPWGSFEEWSRLIGNCVMWLGLPDPQKSRLQLQGGADRSKATLRTILLNWPTVCGGAVAVTARGAIDRLYPGRPGDWQDGLRTAIEEVTGTAPGVTPMSTALGTYLRGVRGRVVGEHYFDGDGKSRDDVVRWRVIKCGGQEAAGDAGGRGRTAEKIRNKKLQPGNVRPPAPPATRAVRKSDKGK